MQVAGLRGNPGIDPSYAVTKFGVIGMTQVAASKLCKDKIRVNCVSPTSVETVSRVCSGLSLPGVGEALAIRCTDVCTQMGRALHRCLHATAPRLCIKITFEKFAFNFLQPTDSYYQNPLQLPI